jgi:hypothetical protein
MPYAALMDAFRRGAKRTSARPNRVHLANRFQTALIRIAGRSYVPTLMAEGLTINSEETDCGQEGWMFGGVTQELLAKSQLCCLFSH